ncbi:MAG: hypothetical protein AAGP08_00125 [Pseudomonadota bacterium]
MASPNEVANDLSVRAAMLKKHRYTDDDLQRALMRGAETIRKLIAKVADLEALAEKEAAAFERYRQGAELEE